MRFGGCCATATRSTSRRSGGAQAQNLRAHPAFTFHLKQLLKADLPATAREITEEPERREVFSKIAKVWNRDVETMLVHSPLVEVTIEGFAPAG